MPPHFISSLVLDGVFVKLDDGLVEEPDLSMVPATARSSRWTRLLNV